MTALTTTFAYEDVLDYLERDFLPSLSNQVDESAALAATPLRQKRVGAAELTLGTASSFQTVEEVDHAFNQLSSTLIPNLEVMIDSISSSGVSLRGKTAESLLEVLNRCMDSVLSLTSSVSSKLSSLQLCLVMSNRIVQDMEGAGQTPPSWMNARFKLNQTIARVFRHLEKVPATRSLSDLQMQMYSNCFRACLKYFSRLILLGGSINEEDDSGVFEEVYTHFEDYRIVESIIFQSRPDGRVQPISSSESCAVLDFLSLLASCGHSGLLSFLLDSEIAPLLNEILRAASKRPSPSSSPQTGLFNSLSHRVRGYRIGATTVPASGVAPKVSWELDQNHENAIRVYRFLAVSVRAADESYTSSPKDKALKKKFFDRALYCLQSSEISIEECLIQVASATMSENTTAQPSQGRKGLTIQVLREASAIFALLTELCDGDQDIFYQHYAKLYSNMVELARQVVLSTSCFVGAAGMARELFQNLSAMEKGNSGSLSGGAMGGTQLGFSPVIDVTGSGRSNTRHEAIQFSHFVSGCSTPVSSAEEEKKSTYPDAWKPNNSAQGSADARQQPELTESSLEQNSKLAITNDFAFAIEREASQCLFYASSMIWSTHPATKSFVEFTPEEISSIHNDISWVKTRDIVAFRTDDSRRPGRALGEVLYVDTVNLCLHVRLIHGTESMQSVLVPLHRLTGVEDRTKRQGTMTFAQAPETSVVLKKSRRELSIGHLVFAMRWCHEFQHEEKLQGSAESPWIRMTADVLSLLVAKEVSLQRESTSPRISAEQARMFKAQLLDLFGTEDEYSRFSNPEYGGTNIMRTKGRLNELLPPDLLGSVRQHLGKELEDAINHILAIQDARKQQAALHHSRYTALADVRMTDRY